MFEKYFEFKKNKTDLKTEIIAGVTTFLTMAYIMFLNPVILKDSGFDFGGSLHCNYSSVSFSVFHNGLLWKNLASWTCARYGLNAFVAYYVCKTLGYSPDQALGAVLVAGVVF